MRKSTKLKIFRRKKRSVILSVLKRHSLRQHTAAWLDEETERWKKEASAEISGDRLSGSLISADAF